MQKMSTRDLSWVLTLFGTAIGAGVLYLPIQAGVGGLWVLLLVSALLFPMTYWSHSNLTRLVAGSPKGGDITQVVENYLGRHAGLLVTMLYFLVIVSILLVYAIGLTNAVQSLLRYQLKGPVLARSQLALLVIMIPVSMVLLGQSILPRLISLLVYPLMFFLLAIALFLIPSWHPGWLLHQSLSWHSVIHVLMFMPILVFATNFSPICSSLAQAYRQELPEPKSCVKKTDQLIKANVWLMMVFVLFFVLSCLFCLDPRQVHEAVQHNLSVMTIISRYTTSHFVHYLGPGITIVAIVTSLFGHFMGAREGLNGCLIKMLRWQKQEKSLNLWLIDACSVTVIVFLCWLAATENWQVILIIGAVVAPILALLLYVLPVWVIHRTPSLKMYRRRVNTWVAVVGCLVVVGFVLGKYLS